MNTRNNQSEINVGIDTGKYQLDIYIRPLDIFFSVSNDEKGINEALCEIKKHSPQRIIIEATGRLEHAFIMACAKANLPFVVANPLHIKRFAGAIGRLAKTDPLDAQLIAHYGEAIKPEMSQIKPETIRLMSDLLSRRRQLTTMQTMEKNRLKIMPKEVSSIIKPILTAIKNQIEKVDNKLLKLIEEHPEYQTKNKIIQSMPGIGNIVAFSLLSDMPELGTISNKQAAALIGVAPFNRESGSYKGQRRIRGGRYKIRTAMFMAIMSAIQCNPVFKAKYEQLLATGKPKKLALIACVRKMIVILNSMVRDGAQWEANYAK
ncbi:MAG: IS110 family transposase [Methylococcaceae bacterium]|nr:IS110 family transposase [Methylococcaceae bacterium]